MERIKHERTEDLAREVLKDLKCLDRATFQCAWIAGKPNVNRELLLPALIITFQHPGPASPAFCITFTKRGFATGSPVHDAEIKRVIREKVEKYLKMIDCAPEDMALSEESYARAPSIVRAR